MTSLTGRARGNAMATGVSVFAAAIMLMSGTAQALGGIAALINDDHLVKVGGYLFAFDSTTWGVIHLILGASLAAVGCFILLGKAWAMVIGIVLAVINGVFNFMHLPLNPLWTVLAISIDVLVVWALATMRKA